MPYSQAHQEKTQFIQDLFKNLPHSVAAEQAQNICSSSWDSGIDGWIFRNHNGEKIVTLIGFGDKITTFNLKRIPTWLVTLINAIYEKYPSDGIYVNGKYYPPKRKK